MPTRRRIAPITTAAIMLAVIVLVGCNGGSDEAVASLDVATPSSPSVSPTPALNSKQLFTLHVEQTHAAERTAFALSGIPTWTPGAPRPYTGPTMTPVLGLLRGCANTSSLEPYMISCWAGWYDGHIMGVRSGREGRAGDITQGLIRVYNTDTQELHFYRTPDKAGAIQITAVDGTLFTLTTVDHTPTITYTFDLATRQLVRAPTSDQPSSTTSIPTATAVTAGYATHTPDPNYSDDARQATEVALVHTLATLSPIPSIAPGEYERRDASPLWEAAQATAHVLYPPPPGYPFTTPVPQGTPWIVTAHREAGSGTIWEDNNPYWKMLVTVNQWVERVGDTNILVCAGHEGVKGDPQQGVVMVVEHDAVSGEITRGPDLYTTPSRSGGAKVIDALGERLTLRAEDGTVFYFDVPTRQWVSPP